MALPLNSTPVYQLTIPSTEKTVKFRPFLVKEEKSLLLAQQSEDPNVMINTLQDVIKSCIKDDIDVGKLAIFDLEYIFTQIRAKSVGEEVELVFKCQHCDDEKAKVKVKIDLTKLEVSRDAEHTNKIPLFGSVGVVLKYPNINLIRKLESISSNSVDDVFQIITECMDYIYDENEIYHASEQTDKELKEFLNNLTTEQFGRIQKFFDSMPKLTKDIEYTCPVCSSHNEATLSGIQSFF
jgi:ribosomal protein L44E